MQKQASPLQGLKDQRMQTLTVQEPEKVVKRRLEASEEEDKLMPKKLKKMNKKRTKKVCQYIYILLYEFK